MLALLALLATAHADCSDPQDTGITDTAVRFEDCDGDGWRKKDGDCNDNDPEVNPSKTEKCDDDQDNNCDGFFNEGCESASRRGTLLGGSACGNSNAGWLILAPLFLAPLVRKRRAR